MLDAGARLIGRLGLSLSLEHVSMEDLIKDAGVSRTSSYRRWPTKDAFAADLLLHIAENTRLTTDFAPYASAVRLIDPELVAHLDDPQARWNLIVEAFRTLTAADFAATMASETWRSYLVLRTAQGSLPDGALRERIRAALATTERSFTDYRARALQAASGLMGFRLRYPDALGWHPLAELLSASFTGMALRGYSGDDDVITERLCSPFGSTHAAPWTLATLASGNNFFGATELDPNISWDAERLAQTRALLADADAILGRLWRPSP